MRLSDLTIAKQIPSRFLVCCPHKHAEDTAVSFLARLAAVAWLLARVAVGMEPFALLATQPVE